MCEMASFKHRLFRGDLEVRVADLTSHGDTQKRLGLSPKEWHDGHYKPDGTIECRVPEGYAITEAEANERVRNRWPTFFAFLSWCFQQPDVLGPNGHYSGSLDLSWLTSAQGLVLPKTIGGYLYLSGLTSADRKKALGQLKSNG